jgi:DNA-binding NarL/FixJ family response regulator
MVDLIFMPISLAIIEDLDEVRDGLKNFLALSTEFQVLETFKTAEDALAAWPRCQPDIFIVDINLPGMNGIEFLRKAGGGEGRTQFMMFTVYENDEKVFEALKAGASGYLLKNTGLVHIIEALKELHQGGSPMSSAIARKLVRALQERGGKERGGKEHGRNAAMRDSGPAHWDPALSPRENEILQLLARGLLYKEISDQLHISTSTVRQHIHRIYEKLHVQNRTEAINKTYKK